MANAVKKNGVETLVSGKLAGRARPGSARGDNRRSATFFLCEPADATQVLPPLSLPKRRDEYVIAVCDGMIDLSAHLFGVGAAELRDTGRCRAAVARVRQVAMYVTHVILQLSMTETGTGFGRDRTTVIHACHLVEDLRDDPDFDRIVTVVERTAARLFRLEESASHG